MACDLQIVCTWYICSFTNYFLGFSGGPYGVGPFEGPLAKRSRGMFGIDGEEKYLNDCYLLF